MTRATQQADCLPGRKQHFWKDGACYYCDADQREFDRARKVENERRRKGKLQEVGE